MAKSVKKILPLVAFSKFIIFPDMTYSFDIPLKSGLAKILKQAHDNEENDQEIFVATRTSEKEEITKDTVNPIGVICKVSGFDLKSDTVKASEDIMCSVFFTGVCRAQLTKISLDDGAYIAHAKTLENKDDIIVRAVYPSDEALVESRPEEDTNRLNSMVGILKDLIIQYGKVNPKNLSRLKNCLDHPSRYAGDLLDKIAMTMTLPTYDILKILNAIDINDRFVLVASFLMKEIGEIGLRMEVVNAVKEKIEKNQRNYILREQLKYIKNELGDKADETDEEAFKRKASELVASDEVKDKILREIDRYSNIPKDSTEGAVQRYYIETLLELPWDKASVDNQDINRAEEILNRDHYGLDKVKERVLEFLSVRILTDKGDSPILCLVGPPGTGKTSIAKSIAEALNKEYVRISLGGVRDEAEIRGHRRAYVGAAPGNIVNGLKQAGTRNPLMLLDEIDKTSKDYHGDTSAALLEVLDSAQNSKFKDHYVDMPVDLSDVLFIATANDRGAIPRPLLDRMEVVEIPGYTSNEKFHIAKEHLIKKQFKANGIKASSLKISDKAIEGIIEHYTKEAGVRSLERCIGKICRKAARAIVQEGKKSVSVSGKNLSDFLGVKKFDYDKANEKDEVGIVRGLAWTQVGGDTLQIEVNVMPGEGKVQLTGQLGDVMKESAQAGISYIRSIASDAGISPEYFKENDFHIHIPEGAVPKDGPSAGITMATAIYSAITGRKVKASVAMTGEITLRGRVLPIGGLKEKLLAAKTAGIKTVLVPIKNEPSVSEIDDEIKDGLDIIFVETMDQVLKQALV